MKLGILGTDEHTAALLAAVKEGPHEVAWVSGWDSPHAHALAQLAPQAEVLPRWESALADRETDLIVVARHADQERRADQIRKLIAAGKPLLVSHPIHDSLLVGYELEMIREEAGMPVVPLMASRFHPAVAQLQQCFGPGGALGDVQKITIERGLPSPDRVSVSRRFAADVDFARVLCGELNRITAMGAAGSVTGGERPVEDEAVWASLGIGLSGPAGVMVHWSVEPASSQAGLRLTVAATAGRAVLEAPDEGPWRLHIAPSGSDETKTVTFDRTNVVAEALRQFESDSHDGIEPPTLIDAARCVELAETLPRCLRRGRTVELFFENYNEQSTFKGMMISVGCAVLVLALVLLVAAAIVDSMLGQLQNQPWARLLRAAVAYTPYVLLAMLGLFLALQALRVLLQPKRPDDSEPA